MDNLNLVDKLREKANISYEEAKYALENNNWDILDAMSYLEGQGRIKKPSISIFYTNEDKEGFIKKGELVNLKKEKYRNNSKNNFEGIFEEVCRVIDTCNNIFFEIRRKDRVLLKLPLTVLVLLLLFVFWIIIPLIIVGLFFEIEFLVSAKKVNTDKINKVFSEISKNILTIKEKFKKGFN